jgi:hypothetical protein
MASLTFAVRGVIAAFESRVPYETVADAGSDALVILVEIMLKISLNYEKRMNSLCSSDMAGELSCRIR